MRRDETAQMMLLTAVILLIGFVALAGMVARVGQLADETVKESRSGSVLETAAVVEGINRIFSRLEALVPPGEGPETQAYMDAVKVGLDLFFETAAVVEGINTIFSRLEALVPPGEGPETQAYMDAVADALVHLDELQSARGYSFTASLGTCVDNGATIDFLVTGSSSHADVRAKFTVSHSILDADYAADLACP